MDAAPEDFPIVDPHQHFWDLSLGKHPWLRDEPPTPFRYGDTRPLRRDYLPADYRRDTRGHRIAATVYVETEWDPRDPLGETRWVEALDTVTVALRDDAKRKLWAENAKRIYEL